MTAATHKKEAVPLGRRRSGCRNIRVNGTKRSQQGRAAGGSTTRCGDGAYIIGPTAQVAEL